MMIHTDKITDRNLNAAAKRAGVEIVRTGEYGSRTHARRVEVILTGSNTRQGRGTGLPAATFDEWGVFLASLFRVDPSASIPKIYDTADVFHYVTGDRFASPLPPKARHAHTFRPCADDLDVHACTDSECTAIRRVK